MLTQQTITTSTAVATFTDTRGQEYIFSTVGIYLLCLTKEGYLFCLLSEYDTIKLISLLGDYYTESFGQWVCIHEGRYKSSAVSEGGVLDLEARTPHDSPNVMTITGPEPLKIHLDKETTQELIKAFCLYVSLGVFVPPNSTKTAMDHVVEDE